MGCTAGPVRQAVRAACAQGPLGFHQGTIGQLDLAPGRRRALHRRVGVRFVHDGCLRGGGGRPVPFKGGIPDADLLFKRGEGRLVHAAIVPRAAWSAYAATERSAAILRSHTRAILAGGNGSAGGHEVGAEDIRIPAVA
jgi:hypothetical protein